VLQTSTREEDEIMKKSEESRIQDSAAKTVGTATLLCPLSSSAAQARQRRSLPAFSALSS
jgi:hypothetical protein